MISGLHEFLDVTGNKGTGAMGDLSCYDGSMLVKCKLENVVEDIEFGVDVIANKNG